MKTLRYAILASVAFVAAPQMAFAQCYQNGLPCTTNQTSTAGQPASTTGQQIMGTDSTNSQIILTDTSGRIITNVNSLPALPTGSNTIGTVNIGTAPNLNVVNLAGTNSIGTVGLNAGTNAIGTVGVTALPALPTGSNTIGSIANTAFGISGTLPSFASTQTFNIGTAPTITTNAQGAVTTAAPSYTSGNPGALSLTTAGALRVDGSATTQPVSGTITANIGTTNGLALAANQPAVATAGAAMPNTGTVLYGNSGGNARALTMDGNGLYVQLLNGGNTNGLALDTSVQAVKTALGSPFQAGASIGNTSFGATQSGTWNVGLSTGTNSIGLVTGQAAVTTAAPSYTSGNTASLSLTTAGALRVDGSAVTQPVSGSVAITGTPTVNIGTAPNLNVVNLAGTNSIGTVGLNAGTNTIGNVLRSVAYTESSTALAASGTFTGATRGTGSGSGVASPFNYFTCFVFADQTGTLTMSGSNDGSTFFKIASQSIAASTPVSVSTRTIAQYFQCKVVNGTTAQGTFFLNSQLGE